MGEYLNPSDMGFRESLNSQIYVDKSELIKYTNSIINTKQKYACISRPRRFGKTMAAEMLIAYYNHQLEADALFGDLKIAKAPSYAEHKNKYNVLMLNMINFLTPTQTVADMIALINKYLVRDLLREYGDVDFFETDNFIQMLKDVYYSTGRQFIVIIDEWDCLFREYQDKTDAQREYLNFLRNWLKDQEHIALAYMTGILPIKKYGQHSALNMFTEYSMTDPGKLAPFVGFTEAEVFDLCKNYRLPFEEVKAWYDGYYLYDRINDEYVSIYSPKSVVDALCHNYLANHWNKTETYEALRIYIEMNYDGLKDAVVTMLAGGSIVIDSRAFTNDMTTFDNKDDVLTLLVHLGYLNFDPISSSVAIPNREVSDEYITSIDRIGWHEVVKQIKNANKLLHSLWDMDADTVARSIDEAHNEVSILQYNDENALSYIINLAFFTAREYYTVIRELPSGKGFADICFVPRTKFADKPAVLIELKWDKSVEGALAQIQSKQYTGALTDHKAHLLLVGINYDKKKKTHACEIKRYVDC